MQIRTKQEFYRHFQAGRFGNHGPMWNTIDEWDQSGYPGLIAIRSKVPRGRCIYDIPRERVRAVYADMRQQYQPNQLHFSAMAPDDRLTLQGEVGLTPRGVELHYSRVPGLNMRVAMSRSLNFARGLTAVAMLRHFMDAGSYDWLQSLFIDFPGAVVEFTSYEIPWGVVRGANTVFWECRTSY